MKVLCIDDDLIIPEDCIHPDVNVVFNEIYTVVDSDISKKGGILMYKLAEIPDKDDAEFYWDADAFVPLSGIDETEMERNFNATKMSV